MKLINLLLEAVTTIRNNPTTAQMLPWFSEHELQRIRFVATSDKNFYTSPAHEYEGSKRAFDSMKRRLKMMRKYKTPVFDGTAQYNPFKRKFVLFDRDKKKLKENPDFEWISKYVGI